MRSLSVAGWHAGRVAASIGKRDDMLLLKSRVACEQGEIDGWHACQTFHGRAVWLVVHYGRLA